VILIHIEIHVVVAIQVPERLTYLGYGLGKHGEEFQIVADDVAKNDPEFDILAVGLCGNESHTPQETTSTPIGKQAM